MVGSSRCRILRTASRPGSQRFALATVLEVSNVLVLSTRCDRGPVAVRCRWLKEIDEFANHAYGRVLDLFGIENDLL